MAGVLITGGTGFVGLNVIEQLLARGDEVTVADRRALPQTAAVDFARLPGRLRRLDLDVADARAVDELMAAVKPAKVLHAAAVTAGPARDAADPRAIVEVNLLGTINVLDAARKAGVGRIVYPSTGALFGRAGAEATQPLDEDADRPLPGTLYGITKFAAERSALRLAELWGLDLLVGRVAMVYGRWEHATGLRDTLTPIWKVTRMAMAGERAVYPAGKPADWIYGVDIARALITLLDAPSAKHRLYHLGVGHGFSLDDWCARLKARYPQFDYGHCADPKDSTLPGVSTPWRMRFSGVRLREEFGFAEAYPVDRAFDDYMSWIESHRSMLELEAR